MRWLSRFLQGDRKQVFGESRSPDIQGGENVRFFSSTYQNGVPNTVIGPPTAGERVLGDLRKDSLGAWWKCTAAGTPGTWQQILPAAVAGDPASGTVPVGYLVLNVTTGTLKRHAGGYVWETLIGGSATVKVGFWSTTLQPLCLPPETGLEPL